MSCWEILGIAPGSDEREIKRAYARQLKVTRPEDDPARFQALRHAYEYALDSASQDDFDDEPVVAEPAETVVAEIEAQAEVARPDYSARRQFIRAQPVDIAVSSQPPQLVARSAWEEFVEKCGQLTSSEAEYGSFAVAKAKEALLSVLKQERMEALEAREIFKGMAIAYCAGESGLPLVRITCLDVLKWEEERNLVNFHNSYQARHAIDRAIADKQYAYLLDEAPASRVVSKLLEPGEPHIRWRDFYKPEFANEMKRCIWSLRNTMPEVEFYRLGREKIATWLDAADRPWPSTTMYMFAFLAGTILTPLAAGAISDGNYFMWMSPAVRMIFMPVLFLALFMLPAIAMAVYPRYLYRPVQIATARITANPRVHLGWWAACAVTSSLAFFLPFLPSVCGQVFIAVIGALALGDLFLKSQFNMGYLVFVAMMIGLISSLFSNAMSSFVGAEVVFMPVLVSALFVSPRLTMLKMYGLDWYNMKPRAILLGIGIVLACLEYLLAQRLPLLAALLGWWWILAAVTAADIFFMSLARKDGQGGAFIWVVFIVLLLYSPRWIEIHSPVEGMLHFQMAVGMSLLFGMLQNGWASFKARKKS